MKKLLAVAIAVAFAVSLGIAVNAMAATKAGVTRAPVVIHRAPLTIVRPPCPSGQLRDHNGRCCPSAQLDPEGTCVPAGGTASTAGNCGS